MGYSPEEIAEIRKHQIAFLTKEKARTASSFYVVEGVQIKVNPGVFPPATDTRLLAANIRASRGDRTLDITAGSGVISVIAGLQGASGYAVDINPSAVTNSQENFSLHKVTMNAILSDMFGTVPKEKYDQIFANGPFFDDKVTDPLDNACYGAKTFVKNILTGIKSFLKPSGKLMIVMAEWTDLGYLEQVAVKNNLTQKIIGKKSSDDGKRIYRLYEIKLA